jgi:glycosyltransferase involved in cell wall biosynthesis
VVLDGVNGFLVNPLVPEELAAVMARFIEHRETVADFGQRSLEIVAEYSTRRAAAVLAASITQALAGGN